MINRHKLALGVLAAAIALSVMTLGLPHQSQWYGDGQLLVNGRHRYRAAMTVTKDSRLFGLQTRYAYQVTQFDQAENSYTRLRSCYLQQQLTTVCYDTKKSAYALKLLQVPAQDQFSDDDGVDVGN